MKKIYIKENKLSLLKNITEDITNEEVTYYEFFTNIKPFLKDLLDKPAEANPNGFFTQKNISKKDLLDKMEDLGIIEFKEKIIEEPKHPNGKKVAKHIIEYKIKRNNFEIKMHELYKDLISNDLVTEDGEAAIGGATSCDSSNSIFVQPITKNVQRKGFFYTSMTRNKDEDNKSISIN